MSKLLFPPFDSPDRADLVIRTSDRMFLFVRKVFLIESSEFFSILFADSSPNETFKDIPMYRVPENVHTMAAILWLSYPTSDIPWDSVYEVLPLLIPALRKYIMEDVEKVLRTAVLKSDALKREPLRIFAIARQYGWEDVARAAARSVLSIPILEHGVVEEMKMVTAFDYQLLLDYFRRSSEAAPGLMQTEISQELPRDSPVITILSMRERCIQCKAKDIFPIIPDDMLSFYGHPWIKVMLQNAREMLKEQPGKSLMDPQFVDNAISLAARECPTQGAAGVRALLEVFDGEVKRSLANIELKLED